MKDSYVFVVFMNSEKNFHSVWATNENAILCAESLVNNYIEMEKRLSETPPKIRVAAEPFNYPTFVGTKFSIYVDNKDAKEFWVIREDLQ